MLGRALQKLGDDLYANKTQCLTELIQNADDNRYAPEVVPTLAFTLCPDGLLCQNNENGFSERDVSVAPYILLQYCQWHGSALLE